MKFQITSTKLQTSHKLQANASKRFWLLGFWILNLFVIWNLGFVIFTPNEAYAALISKPPTNLGLVGYWSMNEGTGTVAGDGSGNGNRGTLTGGPTWVDGKRGKALSFDGVDDYVDGGNVGNVQTISYWIKSSNQANGGIELNSNQYVDDNAIPEGMVDPTLYVDGVVKTLYGSELVTNNDMEVNGTWVVSGTVVSQAQSSEQAHRGTYSWKIVTSTGWNGAQQSKSTSNGVQYKASGWFYKSSGVNPFLGIGNLSTSYIYVAPTISAGSWNYSRNYGTSDQTTSIIAIRSNNGATTAYFDDVSLKQVLIRYPITDTNWRHVVITTNTAVSASAVKIGKGGTSYMNGLIDEVRVYNRALSAAEVLNLYKVGASKINLTPPNSPSYVNTSCGDNGIWGATSISFSHSTSGNSRLLVVSFAGAAGNSVTSGTYAGQSLIKLTGSSYGGATAELWYLINPPTGSNTVSLTLSNGEKSSAGATTYTNVNQSSPFRTTNTEGSSDTSYNATVSGDNTDLVIDMISTYTATSIPNGSQTERFYCPAGSVGAGSTAQGSTKAGGSSVTMTWTNDGRHTVLTAVPIRGAPRTAKINSSQNSKLTNGLVGMWSFNGPDMSGVTAYDRSGQGNNGTLTNGPSRVAGKIGQALSFDGVNDYVSIPDSVAIDVETVTVSAWIKTTQTTEGEIIEKWINTGTPARYPYVLRINNATVGKAFFRAYDGTNNPGATSTTNINNGAWHHLVGVRRDGTDLRLYVDGVLESTATDTTTGDTTNDLAIGIGARRTTAAGPFNGLIDEVRVYNRALTPAEIKRLYNMGR